LVGAGGVKGVTMQAWEYHLVRAPAGGLADLEVMLNGLGSQGWELVAVRNVPGDRADDKFTRQALFFKRPVPPPDESPESLGQSGTDGSDSTIERG